MLRVNCHAWQRLCHATFSDFSRAYFRSYSIAGYTEGDAGCSISEYHTSVRDDYSALGETVSRLIVR